VIKDGSVASVGDVPGYRDAMRSTVDQGAAEGQSWCFRPDDSNVLLSYATVSWLDQERSVVCRVGMGTERDRDRLYDPLGAFGRAREWSGGTFARRCAAPKVNSLKISIDIGRTLRRWRSPPVRRHRSPTLTLDQAARFDDTVPVVRRRHVEDESVRTNRGETRASG